MLIFIFLDSSLFPFPSSNKSNPYAVEFSYSSLILILFASLDHKDVPQNKADEIQTPVLSTT